MSFIGPELPSHLINKKNNDKPSEKGPQIPPQLVQQSTLNIYDEDDNDNGGPQPAVTIGPSIPAEFLKAPEPLIDNNDDDDYGPDFPPHLGKEEAGPSTGKRKVGPTFPSYAPTYDPTTYHNNQDDDDDDDDDFGPKPLPAGMQHQQTDAVKEFIEREEKRRKLVEVRPKPCLIYILFLIPFSFVSNRMLPNPRAYNETNGCLSHLPRQVFSEVSNNSFSTCPNIKLELL
jgi:hypothetical protein